LKLSRRETDMSKRWVAGVLLFALGFGSAFLVRLGSAEAQGTSSGEAEKGSLRYTVGNEFTLTNISKNKAYLAVARGKGGNEPQLLNKFGAAVFSKKDPVYVYRLTPVGVWGEARFRPCHDWELCPVPQPIPPPPPPLRITAVFIEPRDMVGRPGMTKLPQ
jgi:hypothetical protein